MREDILEAENELKEVKKQEESIAKFILEEQKNRNKELALANERIFVICIMLIVSLFISVGYIVYLLNDTNTEKIIDIDDVSNIDSSTIENN